MILKTECEKITNKANAQCSVCNKTPALSNAGQSALTDHANGRKQSEAVKKIRNFLLLQRNQQLA